MELSWLLLPVGLTVGFIQGRDLESRYWILKFTPGTERPALESCRTLEASPIKDPKIQGFEPKDPKDIELGRFRVLA
jgi:hypothetical protein